MQNLLNQDVSHSFDVLVATRVGVIVVSSSAKADTGVTVAAVIFVVSNYTNSCFGVVAIDTNCVESFLVTVGL